MLTYYTKGLKMSSRDIENICDEIQKELSTIGGLDQAMIDQEVELLKIIGSIDELIGAIENV